MTNRLLAAIWISAVVAGLVAAGCSNQGTTGAHGTTVTTSGPRKSTTTSTSSEGTKAGLAWGAPVKVTDSVGLVQVSCPATSFCMGIDASGSAYRFDGGKWSSGMSLSGGAAASSGTPGVSCPSSSFCAAIAGGSLIATWDGTGWSAPVTVGGAASLQALSCSDPSFCMAMDGIGDAYPFDGSSWLGPVNAYGGANGVSCVNANFCVAALGGVSLWDGNSWSQPSTLANAEVERVSCTSANFCMAVDSAGDAFSWNGTAWSSADHIDSSNAANGGNKLNGVACVQTSFCAAVDDSGHALTWNGASWSAPHAVNGANSLTSISCPSANWCLAVSAAGQAVTARMS